MNFRVKKDMEKTGRRGLGRDWMEEREDGKFCDHILM